MIPLGNFKEASRIVREAPDDPEELFPLCGVSQWLAVQMCLDMWASLGVNPASAMTAMEVGCILTRHYYETNFELTPKEGRADPDDDAARGFGI